MTWRKLVLVGVALIVVAFAVLHVAGARAYVGILSGTMPHSDTDLLGGLAYVLSWFAIVVVVPIAGLTLLFDFAWTRISTWRSRHTSGQGLASADPDRRRAR